MDLLKADQRQIMDLLRAAAETGDVQGTACNFVRASLEHYERELQKQIDGLGIDLRPSGLHFELFGCLVMGSIIAAIFWERYVLITHGSQKGKLHAIRSSTFNSPPLAPDYVCSNSNVEFRMDCF